MNVDITTTIKTSLACRHQSTVDHAQGLRSRIALNEHCSFLRELPALIPLERSVPRCASSIADDCCLHCGSSCGLCTTATLSHAALATLVLVDLYATLFFPATVAVGVLFPALSSWPHPKENVMGHRLLDGLFYFSLVTSTFWLWRMRGLRWVSTSLLVLQQLILIGAGFVAGMSVSGEWL